MLSTLLQFAFRTRFVKIQGSLTVYPTPPVTRSLSSKISVMSSSQKSEGGIPNFTSSKAWDNRAGKFVELMDKFGTPSRMSYDAILNALNTRLPFSQATTILDIGCGTGVGIERLFLTYGKDLPSNVRIISSDFSAGMVEQVSRAKERETSMGNTLWKNVEPLVLDAQDLSSVADASVSHVISSYVLFAVPRADIALKEIHRVLTNNGVFAATSWNSNEWMGLMGNIKEIHPDTEVPGKIPESPWTKPENAVKIVETGGFSKVEAEWLQVWMDVEDPVAYARGLAEIPAFIEVMSRLTKEEEERLYDLIAAQIRREHPGLPSKLMGKVVLSVAKK
jgi:ubiquinone/menaquinone biosynthesis C-methylase UbiE